MPASRLRCTLTRRGLFFLLITPAESQRVSKKHDDNMITSSQLIAAKSIISRAFHVAVIVSSSQAAQDAARACEFSL
jgi:hypothetical protein